MAVTKRADTVIPEVLEEAVRGEFANAQALYGTGAAVVQSRGWPNARGGDRIKIPYFGTIGDFENLASDEGGASAVPALTPAALTMDSDTTLVKHAGKAVEITEWAQMAASYSDPYGEMARQMRVGLERKADAELIATALATTLEHDIYDDTTVATGALTWDELVKARYKWGDEQDDIALIVAHSDVVRDWELEVDSNGRPIYKPANDPVGRVLGSVNGIPVIRSDKLTKTADYGGGGTDTTGYETLLLKRNAMAWWFNGAPTVQTDNDILADTDVAALHVYYATHLYRRPNGGTKLGAIKIIHNVVN